MQVGDLVTAKCRQNIIHFPSSFGIVTKVMGETAYIQWLDDLHSGARLIHFCYLEVVCK